MTLRNSLVSFRKLIIVYGFMAAAFAAKLDVRIQGVLEEPYGGFGPTFLITYQIDQFPSPSSVPELGGFSVPITATLKSGSLNTTESTDISYYSLASGKSGLDIFLVKLFRDSPGVSGF